MKNQANKAKENSTAKKDNHPHDLPHSGLDDWNDRLDKNLESENQGNVTADENAEKYSTEKGSGNQSDSGL